MVVETFDIYEQVASALREMSYVCRVDDLFVCKYSGEKTVALLTNAPELHVGFAFAFALQGAEGYLLKLLPDVCGERLKPNEGDVRAFYRRKEAP